MTSLFLALAAAAAEPILLDAGGPASPVLEEFDRLDRDGATTARARWAVAPDRAIVAGEPDPLAGDAIAGGRLHLDVEPGDWVLHVLLGDPTRRGEAPGTVFGLRVGDGEALRVEVPTGAAWLASSHWASNPFPIFREGETEWERQVEGRWTWRRVEVAAGPDGLEIEAYGLPLQALIAAPKEDEALADVARALAESRRRSWYLSRVAPAAATHVLPELDGSVRAGGWHDDPAALEATRLTWTAAPGEPVGGIVWSMSDAPATFTTQGLTALRLEAHEVHWLDASGHPLRARRPRPAFLRPVDDALRGGQGVPVGLALRGTIPAEAKPGEYEGAVVLTVGEATVRVPVTLEVRALDLAEPSAPTGFFTDRRAALSRAFGAEAPEVEETFARDVALQRARGFDRIGLRFASSPGRWTQEAPPDLSVLRRSVSTWREAGGGTVVWMDPIDPFVEHVYRADPDEGVPDGIGWRWPLLVQAAEEAGDVAVYVYDEAAPHDVEDVERMRRVLGALDEQVPRSVPVAGAVPHPLGWTLTPRIDLVMITTEPRVHPAHGAWIRAQGGTPWAYLLTAGRSSGLLAWGMGVDGFLQWHWGPSWQDPFDQVGRHPTFDYTLLGPDGTIYPTVMLEQLADGLIDQRYLATLEALVLEAEAHPRRRIRRRAERGRRLLDATGSALRGLEVEGVHDGEALSPQSLERIRMAAGDEAERLQRRLR